MEKALQLYVAPDAVSDAGIRIISSSDVYANWSSPWRTNGILRGYRVTLTVLEDYNKPLNMQYDSNLTSTSMNITNLCKCNVKVEE